MTFHWPPTLNDSAPEVHRKPAARHHHGSLRDATVHAGWALLGRCGAADLSVREVARQVGVSHSAFYKHFPDRESLLRAVALRGFDALLLRMTTAILPRAGHSLVPVCADYVQFAQEHPAQFLLMFDPPLAAGGVGETLRLAQLRPLKLLRRAVADFAPGAPAFAAQRATTSLIALVHGFATLVAMGLAQPGPGELAHLDDAVARLLAPLLDQPLH